MVSSQASYDFFSILGLGLGVRCFGDWRFREPQTLKALNPKHPKSPKPRTEIRSVTLRSVK